MPQTLLAFLAMMIVTWMLFGQHRLTIQAQTDAVNAQYELMASAVASERMHYIASHPFDAYVADGTVSRANLDLHDLTFPANFGTVNPAGCIVASACKDVDDFDAHQDTVNYEDGTQLKFAVATTIDYVKDDGSVSSVPTWIKEITVEVKALPPDMPDSFLLAPVQKKRRVSPTW